MALLTAFVVVSPAGSRAPELQKPSPDGPVDGPAGGQVDKDTWEYRYPFDVPNPLDAARLDKREKLLEEGKLADAQRLATAGADRALVILVEYGDGTPTTSDVYTWTQSITPSLVSKWDPFGLADPNQAVPSAASPTVGDCSKIITETRRFEYSGPLHNQLPRPLSATDSASMNTIWTTDFNTTWYQNFLFGNGVVFNYTRQDGSKVYSDLTGRSLRKYYQDMSGGAYDITGDVVGWVKVPHSTWYYGTDLCPGARSVSNQTFPNDSGSPAGKGSKDLVRDAIMAVNVISPTIPGFSWSNYDQNGDGVIDRLWIVHAGFGEEDNTTLLNRTNYGESAIWSHSSSIPNFPIREGISAGPYIMMPENGGINVFAHEAGHNIGLADQYTYGNGNTSIGFWTLMSDSWTGYPLGFLPPSLDAYSLNRLGWLNPYVALDPNRVYEVTVGQASDFPGGADVYRGVQIQLPNGQSPMKVVPWQGSYYWWGGSGALANGIMTSKNSLDLTGVTTATLTFDLAYDLEPDWDFLWVQVSKDGVTWPVTQTLTNAATSCTTASGWIGPNYGFPDDLCGAGLGGFSAAGHFTPANQTFDLSAYTGQNIWLRFWYMTDWGTEGAGPFLDSIVVKKGASNTVVLSDNAEAGDANWTYQAPWVRSNGTKNFVHNFFLQWRNTHMQTGGYDGLALGDSRWRYGPANPGLVVSYQNNFYSNNTIENYVQDWPSFGAKGRHLAVDAHPEPYRDPALSTNYPNAISNLTGRSQMRDATFSRQDSTSFVYPMGSTAVYSGRPSVSWFDDGQGYAPGLEYARRGPLPCANFYWFEKQWDASVALPSAGPYYTTKATGGVVDTTTGIRFRGFMGGTNCGTSWYGYWYVPYANSTIGNTGNPADNLANYGWRVQILSQTDTTAKLKIWNTHYYGKLYPDKTTATLGDTVRYTYKLDINQGAPQSLFVCVPLDLTRVSYVANSATGGAVPQNSACPTSAAAPSAPGATTQSIQWNGYVEHNGTATFTFDVMLVSGGGLFDQNAELWTDGSPWASIPSNPVEALFAYSNFIPMIFNQ
jgi:immune inhibitor A